MKVEIKEFFDEEDGKKYKGIFIGGELFDWSFGSELQRHTVRNSEEQIQAMHHVRIKKHFVKSFSEFVGRTVNLKQINAAIKSGCLE